jgi:hypothetical protein
VEQMNMFEEALARTESGDRVAHGSGLTQDNKRGMIACNRMLTSPRLRERDREFVNSVMRQILARPGEFALSVKQHKWFEDLWRRVNAG